MPKLIKTSRAKYDLENSDDVKKLKRRLNEYGNKKQFDTLKGIREQIKQSLPIGKVEEDLLRYLESKLPQVEQLPIVVEVKTESLSELESIVNTQVDKESGAESGEESFQKLYACLLEDMANYADNIQLLKSYIAAVINLFMHAATYTPTLDYGKSQQREYDSKTQLQYYRSQGEHAQARFFRHFIEKSAEDSGKSRLPLNKGFLAILGLANFKEKSLCSTLKKFDPYTGRPNSQLASKVGSHDIEKIAHAGARKNNFSTLLRALDIVTNDPPAEDSKRRIQEKLKQVLPAKKAAEKHTPEILTARICYLLERFKKDPSGVSASNENLAGHLYTYRTDRIRNLKIKITQKNFQFISVAKTAENTTCLFVQFYPESTKKNDVYLQGVTNVLLSFFAGILNHTLNKKGLTLYAERRQSFGFLRPTLTDAGMMTLRLSLGLEPEAFDDVVLESLTAFHQLLITFNFDSPNHPAVKKVFEFVREVLPVEPKADGEKSRKPRDPDTHIRNCVRGDNNTLQTYKQAEAYIKAAQQEASKHQSDTKKDENYLATALENYLTKYVVERELLSVSHLRDVEREGISPLSSATVKLLQNLLLYVYQFISKLEFLKENEPLRSLVNSYWHSLLKLYTHYKKGQELLDKKEKMTGARFHREATLLIENILEYLISLDGLVQIRAELQKKPLNPVNTLKQAELDYASQTLGIPKEQLHLYFTDSGQQAITISLLTLISDLHGPGADGKARDHDVHLFAKSYFEVESFFADIGKKEEGAIGYVKRAQDAKIIFVDITQLHNLELDACKAMRALVIDMTHAPICISQVVKDKVLAVRNQKKWVFLVESSLKHGELGLDKYQAGKIITIAPDANSLTQDTSELLEMVSNEAMGPMVASYLQMVNEICQDKVKTSTVAAGLFSSQKLPTSIANETHSCSDPLLTVSVVR